MYSIPLIGKGTCKICLKLVNEKGRIVCLSYNKTEVIEWKAKALFSISGPKSTWSKLRHFCIATPDSSSSTFKHFLRLDLLSHESSSSLPSRVWQVSQI